jgi:hypothetical protein
VDVRLARGDVPEFFVDLPTFGFGQQAFGFGGVVRGAVVVGLGADSCSCWIVDVMKT